MPEKWQDEVREILQRADRVDPRSRRPDQTPNASPDPARGANPLNWLSGLGDWTRRRLSSTNEMLVTAASLVVIALILSVVLRQIAAVLAIVGAGLFAVAFLRAVLERRGTRQGGSAASTMWRGQVIDLRADQSTLGERFRSLWRRR